MRLILRYRLIIQIFVSKIGAIYINVLQLPPGPPGLLDGLEKIVARNCGSLIISRRRLRLKRVDTLNTFERFSAFSYYSGKKKKKA